MAGVITLLDQPRTLDALGRATDALIYFYYTGTTVLAPIFDDAALTIPAINPIDLAAGEIFPDTYLDPSLTYRRRILYGDGTIHDVDPLPGTGSLSDFVSVVSFGADPTGVNSSSAAVTAAIASLTNGGIIYFPAGTYKFNTEVATNNKTNLTFMGANAVIKGGATRIRSYFSFDGCTNIVFQGFRFDHLKSSLPAYTAIDKPTTYNAAFYFQNGTNLTVQDCRFFDLYTLSMFFYQSSTLRVENCDFACPTSTNTWWLQFIHMQTYSGENVISDNSFTNAVTTNPAYNPCCVFMSGGATASAVKILNNKADYCGRDNTGASRLGVFDVYGDAANVTVEENISTNTMAQFMRMSSTRNGRVLNNRITMSANAELAYSILNVESTPAFIPGQAGCQDVIIDGNVIEDPSARADYAIGVLSYDWGLPSTDVKVSRNAFTGCKKIIRVDGPYVDVKLVENHSRGGRGSIEVVPNANMTSTVGTEANSRLDNLVISGNFILNDTGVSANPITINWNKAPTYSGTVGRCTINGNNFRATTADTGQAISAIWNASTLQGRITISDNETNNYNYHWFVRGTQEVIVERNRAIAIGTSGYLDDGTNGTVQRRDNRYSIGALEGRATLVAGTVTVNNIEIRTGDTVQLNRLTAGGTMGDISLGTITNATSFVINSNNAADTSVIFWRIQH